LLATTDSLFSIIVSEKKAAGLFRTFVMPRMLALAMKIDRVRRTFFRSIAQLGIRYRRSSLSVTPQPWPEEAPRGGDRFPWLKVKLSSNGPVEDIFEKLDDTKFNLIMFGQTDTPSVPARLGDLVQTLVVPSDAPNDGEIHRANIPRPSFYLLRPDCYIGLCGARLEWDLVTRYLSERI